MNTAATHLATNVAAWVEHEEIIVASFLKKALKCIEWETETIKTLCIMGACIVGAIVRLDQLHAYFHLIS